MDIRLKRGRVEDITTPYEFSVLDMEYGGNFSGEVTVYYAKKIEKQLSKWDVLRVITGAELREQALSSVYGSILHTEEGYYRVKITKEGVGTFSAKTFNS